MTALDAINQQKARIEAVNDALYAAAGDSSVQAVRDRVDTWHSQALLWENLAGVVLEHPERADEWGRLGGKLADDARAIAEDADDETTAGAVRLFLEGMPGALLVVSKNAVVGAADAVKFVAGQAGGAAGAVVSAALGAIPWPVWAALAAVGVVLCVVAVKHGGEIVKAVVPRAP